MLTIHKASAGSGKTYTLAYTYIKLLLGEKKEDGTYRLSKEHGSRHRSILAITFTNKATNEMKSRIVERLSELADLRRECDYRSRLCEELHCSAEALQEASSVALHSLLSDFNFFNVSTIDAFFQTVLRTFAYEASIDGNYEIELNDEYAYTVGVASMMASINREGNDASPETRLLISWLTQFLRNNMDDGKGVTEIRKQAKPGSDLVTFMKRAVSEVFKAHSDEITQYINDSDKLKRFVAELVEKSRQSREDIHHAALQIVESAGQYEGIIANARKIIEKYATGAFWGKLSNAAVKYVDNPEAIILKKYVDNPMTRSLAENISNTLGLIDGLSARNNAYVTILSHIYQMGLFGCILRYIESFRKENNLILLSDTNELLQKIINQDEAPFIYERMGMRLNHFLIDEFQDTSRLQWGNLRPLLAESIGCGHDNLIIGDEKQSIYRFRNADPELLRTDVLQEFAGNCEIKGSGATENTNWRSSMEIVDFNNNIFRQLACKLNVCDIYANVAQEIHHKGIHGYVKIMPYKADDDLVENEKDTDFALRQMIDEIKRQLSAGFHQSDIAVLTSTRNEATMVINYLLDCKEHDSELSTIQVVSEDSFTVGRAESVKLIISILRYIDYRKSIRLNAGDVNRQLATLSNRIQSLVIKGVPRNEAIATVLSGDVAGPENAIDDALEMQCLSLPSLIERIINRFFDEDVLARDNVYITGFQDIVTDFCNRHAADVVSFLQWWDRTGNTISVTSPPNIDAITVMTIHKSKGLEFPCVHIPFASWDMVKSKTLVWYRTNDSALFDGFDKDCLPPFIPLETSRKGIEGTDFEEQYDLDAAKTIVDSLNKTYVAFTRAVNELIIGYSAKKAGRSTLSIARLMQEVFNEQSALYNADERGIIQFGSPVINYNHKESQNMTPLRPYHSLDNDHIWSMSRIDEIDSMEQPRTMGVDLHAMMSMVHTYEDIERAVYRRAIHGFVEPNKINDYICTIKRIVSDPRVAKWFSGYSRLLCERSVIASNIRYRPDRVVWTQEGTIDVVDYKFGELHDPKYAKQVKNYVKLLKQQFPSTKVCGYIWYPLSSQIEKV